MGIEFKPLDRATLDKFNPLNLDSADESTSALLRKMLQVYKKSLADIQKEIEAFYGRYATENELTLAEVHKRLDPKQLESAIDAIHRYYEFADPKKIGKEMSKEYRDELRLLSARAYMSRLEEIKINLKQIIVELAAQEIEAYRETLEQVYQESHALESFNIDKTLGFSEGYSAPNPDVLKIALNREWLGDNFSGRILKDKGNLLSNIETELLSGIARGQNPRKIAETMSKEYNLDYKRCERLARTEIIHCMNQATADSYSENGVEKYKFVCGLDERTCPKCGELDGKVFDLKYAEEGVNYPVMHPNCVLGDNVVIAPDAEALTRSEYSGDIFKIITANGRNLSITPNHIMLTSRGWVRAKNLIKGDKIIYYSAWDKITVVNPADNNGVPTIEKCFASLTEISSMFSRVVPATAEDFKGDVVKNSKIDIILINSLLRNKVNSPLLKFLSDFTLIETSESLKGVLNSDSTLAKFLVCLGLIADGIMSSNSVLDILRFGTLTHHQLVRLRLPSDYNARLVQSANNSRSADIESLGEFVDTTPTVVKADNFINGQISASVGLSDNDSVFSQNSSDRLLGTVENLSEFLNTFSAFIEFDEIVNIDVSHFTGHVYDTSTMSTLYVCNGFFSSNCRCTTIPVFDDEISKLFPTSANSRIAYTSDTKRKSYQVPADMTYKQWREIAKKSRD